VHVFADLFHFALHFISYRVILAFSLSMITIFALQLSFLINEMKQTGLAGKGSAHLSHENIHFSFAFELFLIVSNIKLSNYPIFEALFSLHTAVCRSPRV
jgi:hypothetical protein